MIVVSGLLVAVALVLLALGLTLSLAYIYASIGVSVLAFFVLGLATRQRRAAPVAAPAGSAPRPADPAAEGWSTVSEPADRLAADAESAWPGWQRALAPELPGWRVGPDPEPLVEDDDDLLEDEDLLGGRRYGGTVLVVPGRPRYHVAGCRYLLGKESADLDVLDAREEGFQPCGICRPDVVLAEELSAPELVAETREQRRDVVHLEPGAATVGDALDLLELPEDDRIALQLGTPRVLIQAAEPVPPVEDVVLVLERGRYHRPGCRYARNVPSARPANALVARAAGHLPCGICKP